MDRRMELDPPLARQRDQAERPEPGPERRDGEVRQPGEPGQRSKVRHHRVDLLGADDRDGHYRSPGADRRGDEAAAAETAQPVAVLEVLAGAAGALGEDE